MQQFYEFYMRIGNFKMAKLAAFWSLKKALCSRRSIARLAKCFANVINICIISNSIDVNLDIQAMNHVLRSICDDTLDSESLNNVLELYTKIMQLQ